MGEILHGAAEGGCWTYPGDVAAGLEALGLV